MHYNVYCSLSSLARQCAQLWVKTRESLGYPLGFYSIPHHLVCSKEVLEAELAKVTFYPCTTCIYYCSDWMYHLGCYYSLKLTGCDFTLSLAGFCREIWLCFVVCQNSFHLLKFYTLMYLAVLLLIIFGYTLSFIDSDMEFRETLIFLFWIFANGNIVLPFTNWCCSIPFWIFPKRSLENWFQQIWLRVSGYCSCQD